MPSAKSLRPLTKAPIPLLPNRVWRFYTGGKMIDRLKGKRRAQDNYFPEEWVGSCVQAVNPEPHCRLGEGLALVRAPDGSTVQLKDVLDVLPEPMLGQEHVAGHGSSAALLVKLLDTSVRLLIHAHPTKSFAKEHLNSCFGKTECWLIVETRDDVEEPYVLDSFKEQVSRAQWRKLIDEQDIEAMQSVLHRIPVRAGDAVYVKAGLPHAIGEGIFMVELQEPTDFSIVMEKTCAGFTVPEKDCWIGVSKDLALSVIDHRVYTWEEVQRELVIRPKELRREGESSEVELLGYSVTECFAGNRLTVKGELSDDTHHRFSILIVLDGKGTLRYRGGELNIKRGDQLFIPAALGKYRYTTSGRKPLTIMKCLPASPAVTL